MKPIKVYKSVYNRSEIFASDLDIFILESYKIFEDLGRDDYLNRYSEILSETDKFTRNEMKRAYLPAVDISPANYLSIDIDGIAGDEEVRQGIIDKLFLFPSCYACMDSVSGNLVAFFKFSIEDKNDYKYLYYKLYLELTLRLGINIDFLPELNRLRYVSMGKVHFINRESSVLTDILRVEQLPYIKIQPRAEGTEKPVAKRDIIWKSE